MTTLNTRAAKRKPAAIKPSKTTLPSPGNRARWITAQSPKGGVGKTTCILNLAEFAAHDGLKVVLLDTDLQRSLSKWHARRPAEAKPLIMVSRPLREVRQAIKEIADIPDVDVVLVDTPPAIEYLPDETKILTQQSDLILVPSTTGAADVESVASWMEYLRTTGTFAAFVINRAIMRVNGRGDDEGVSVGTLSYREAQKNLNKVGMLCPMPIRQFEDINNTHRYGVGVAEIKGAKGAEDFEALWHFCRNAAKVGG
ncbi:ParA family protein [Teichococcus vastitatis]|uniref:ParA family protein n=1 Tax=Teichococcus vastitatis TaxID=2307076 RepID=A0ABS9W8H4_9PROT|nr:ParA family protein [Pseudoroseomonas vastitatis]MCI0754914.1 ParA family protein [Pseudoroseomonas vastitatis]